MNIPFLKYKKIFYLFSAFLFLILFFSLLFFGLNFGIDFVGGSILEIDFKERPENALILEKLKELNLGEVFVQPVGERGVILRLKEVDAEIYQKILSKLREISELEEKRFESIGPVIGRELRQKALLLVVLCLAALLIYIVISFSRVKRPISGWLYGGVAIFTLTFEFLILLGIISLLGKFYHLQFSIPIITAILAILGYTINDKIIIFDRIRENLLKRRGEDFENLVNLSLNQSLTRSLATSFSTLLVLFAIFFFGGETLKYFVLVMILGIVIGTYSSLFLAAPLLVSWVRFSQRGRIFEL